MLRKDSSFALMALMFFSGSLLTSSAQVNSWTKPTSGTWEEMYWSLGMLPGPGQQVMITNAGWKAVQIAWGTSQNHPQSLNVQSIVISSPADSYNTLLLNYLGFQTPLSVNRSLIVASNSALTMHSSALQLGWTHGEGLSVGGQVNQNDSTEVIGGQLDVGWIGPGVYNLNSGFLNVSDGWVGGPQGGVFNQNGGTNSSRIIHLEDGTYNLNGGDFNSEVYFGSYTSSGRFRQDGGRINRGLKIFRGTYELNDGVVYGDFKVGISDGLGAGGAGFATQNGGTNFGSIHLGDGGNGYYRLMNGLVQAPSIGVGAFGYYQQMGGTVTTPRVSFVGGQFNREYRPVASGWMQDGYLSTSDSFFMRSAEFHQEGGTNRMGQLELSGALGAYNFYQLSGGLLSTYLSTVRAPGGGGFYQSGGTHRVGLQLSILDSGSYVLSGGQLEAPTIYLFPGTTFRHNGGNIVNSRVLVLVSARFFAGPSQQFGALDINAAYGQPTNELHMPSGPCVLRFADSSGGSWVDGNLIVNNWNGSYLGGGSHQIIFGNSTSALHSWQLSRIFFRDPPGISPGLYGTKILPSGEIVPDTVPPTGRVPPRLALRKQAGGAKQITVTGEAGYNYGVLRSFDLANWTFWTNRVATTGTMSVLDTDGGYSKRFYKAVLMQ